MITRESQVLSRESCEKLIAAGVLDTPNFSVQFAWAPKRDVRNGGYFWVVEEYFPGDIPAFTLLELVGLLGYHEKSPIGKLLFRLRFGYNIARMARALTINLRVDAAFKENR